MPSLLKYTRRPDISFNRNGKIRIRARVVRLLGLRWGDSINIAHVGCEYLLYKVSNTQVGSYHARCSPTNKGRHNFCAYSSQLSRAFMESIGVHADIIAFPVGELSALDDGTPCIPIITNLPL